MMRKVRWKKRGTKREREQAVCCQRTACSFPFFLKQALLIRSKQRPVISLCWIEESIANVEGKIEKEIKKLTE